MISRRKHGRWLSGIAHCFRRALSASHDLAGELFFSLLLLRQFRLCLALSELLSCCATVRVWIAATFGFMSRFIFFTRSELPHFSSPPEVGFCIGDSDMKQANKAVQSTGAGRLCIRQAETSTPIASTLPTPFVTQQRVRAELLNQVSRVVVKLGTGVLTLS
jgi:hypothetical protein